MAKFRSEKEILDDVNQLIVTHMGETGLTVKTEVRGDRVTLWGTVDNLAEKNFLAQRVKRIQGVREMDNSLTVATDGKVTDQDIQEEILKLFSDSKHDGISGLGCRVSKGNVTLLGHGDNQNTVRLATQLASQVRGTKEIRSEIQIPSNVDDITLVNRVEDALIDSPWLNAQEIKTTAEKGIITLSGMVDKQEEIEWAVDLAYQIPGVKAVVSEILCRHNSQGEDLWLTEQLVSRLGRHSLNSGQVRAFVQEGIAFLSGQVYSDEDRTWAENAIQGIEGIIGVNNGITVNAYGIK